MSDRDTRRLGRWLDDTRKAWGWSRRKLSEQGGPDPKNQSIMINKPRTWLQERTIESIAHVTGVPPDDLQAIIRGEDVPIPEHPPHREAPAATGGLSVGDQLVELRREVAFLGQQVARLVEHQGRDR